MIDDLDIAKLNDLTRPQLFMYVDLRDDINTSLGLARMTRAQAAHVLRLLLSQLEPPTQEESQP